MFPQGTGKSPEPAGQKTGPTRHQRAFTLLEVILAMMIAAGLLVVAIYFYQQIGQLRGQSVREIQKLSTLRLLMDKIASDLRSAHSLGYFDSGFVGGG